MDEITTDNHAYSKLIMNKLMCKGIDVTEKMAKNQRRKKHGDWKQRRTQTHKESRKLIQATTERLGLEETINSKQVVEKATVLRKITNI